MGHPVALGPEPEGGDECPSSRGNDEHKIQAGGEEIHISNAQGELILGMDDGRESGEKPVRHVLVPFFPEVTGESGRGEDFFTGAARTLGRSSFSQVKVFGSASPNGTRVIPGRAAIRGIVQESDLSIPLG